MVSVAMTLYNSEKFIEKQLESIRNQTESVDEVVMVDDCSSDGTVDWVVDYLKKNGLDNWKLIRHEKNVGYIDSFFDSIKRCSGDIILLCDHDDVWLPNKVKIIKKVFNNHSDVMMLATKFNQIDEHGKRVEIRQKANHANNNLIRRKVKKNTLNKMTLRDVAIYNLSPGCTCAIRNDVKDLFLSSRCALPHDWTLSIIAACKDGLYYLDQATTEYRIYDQNTIGLGHEKEYEKRKRDVNLNFLEKRSMIEIVRKYKKRDSEDFKYCQRVVAVFLLRKKAMENRSVRFALSALMRSFGLPYLYESVLLDLITIVK